MPKIDIQRRKQMTQKKFKREDIKKMLLENECIVEFTKVDGEKRTMPCTLNAEMMPPPPEVKEGKEPKKKKPENMDTIGAWCTDKKAWRSFRVANVTDVTIVD